LGFFRNGSAPRHRYRAAATIKKEERHMAWHRYRAAATIKKEERHMPLASLSRCRYN
jgi:hypothetical protein